MVRVGQIAGDGRKKVKIRELAKVSLKGCCGKVKKFRVGRQMLKIYISCFISLLASAFAITMLFPFLPFMVQFLRPELKEDKESIGKYAGIVASSMFFGRFFGSYVWGAVADRKGRKPVIITSCLLLGLFSAAFGFSVNFAMAVLFRLAVGLTNGVVGTVKAVISEASDDTNQAFGISLISCAWGLGLIIGPAVSGAIADPIGQYNLNISNAAIHGFLTKFPYSLPCIVNLLLCVVGAVTTLCLLPETLGVTKNRKKDELLDEEGDNKQDEVSSSSDNEEQNATTDCEDMDTGDGSTTDVDLGTLGRRPFAMRDNNAGTDSRSPEVSVTLETIVETPDSGIVSSLTDTTKSSCSPNSRSSPHNDSGMDLDSHTGGNIANTMDESPCNPTENTNTCSTAARSTFGDSATNCTFVGVTKGDNELDSSDGSPTSQSDLSQGQQLLAGDIEEVDLGEMKLEAKDEVDTDTTGTGKRKKLKQTDESGGKSTRKIRRSSSFLIPFFNRRESFTVSFVKPSQSLLRRKAELESRKGATKEGDEILEEEEVQIKSVGDGGEGGDMGGGEGGESGDMGGGEGGESDRDRLLEEEEVSQTRRLMKKIARSIFNSLLDLKLFLCHRTSFLSILAYCVFSFAVIGFDEIYSVWAATPPYLGGLGFTLSEIGISMAIIGVLLVPLTLLLFPMLEKRFGAIKSFHISCIPVMVTAILLPNLHYLVPSGQKVLLWILLLLIMLILRIGIVSCFGALMLFINNSVTFDKLGAINGLAVSLTALFRTAAPLFSGGVFSASLSKATRAIGFPLDSHLVFLIFGVVFLLTVVVVASLPLSINRQKVVD